MSTFAEVGNQLALRSELLKRRDVLRGELQQVRAQQAANETWLRQHQSLVKGYKLEQQASAQGESKRKRALEPAP